MSGALRAFTITVEGRTLNRGFWLYVIDIKAPAGQHLYVGRTGDNSSPNAQSPFWRISQHLDPGSKAKGNALTRNLLQVGIDPVLCQFEMTAIGPIFAEQADFDAHRPFRDQVGALESELATVLRGRGYSVLGTHSARCAADPSLLQEVLQLVELRFPARGAA
jgi:hypothetical protein